MLSFVSSLSSSSSRRIFPVMLLATSSILADRSIRYDLIQDRFRCQVWLWLAVALSLYSPITNVIMHQQGNSSATTTTTTLHDTNDAFLIFETWVHLIFFSNMMVVSTIASSISKQSAANLWRTTTTAGRRRNGKYKLFLVADLLPFASWCAMVSTLIVQAEHQTNENDSNSNNYDKQHDKDTTVLLISVQVFVVSLILFYMLQWHTSRKRKVSKELRGIPSVASSGHVVMNEDHNNHLHRRSTTTASSTSATTTTTNTNAASTTLLSMIDESVWYTWNVSTTMKWIAMNVFHPENENGTKNNFSNDDNDNNNNYLDYEEERDYLMRLLAPHRISGSILHRLTNPFELTKLDFPYGPACQLAEAIEVHLIQRYPRPVTAQSTSTTAPQYYHNGSSNGPSNYHHHINNNNSYYNHLSIAPPPPPHLQQQQDDWLSLHDQEYNQWARQQVSQPSLGKHHNSSTDNLPPWQYDPNHRHAAGSTSSDHGGEVSNATASDKNIPPMDPEQHARLEAIMKEKYGMGLPQLATTASTTTTSSTASVSQETSQPQQWVGGSTSRMETQQQYPSRSAPSSLVAPRNTPEGRMFSSSSSASALPLNSSSPYVHASQQQNQQQQQQQYPQGTAYQKVDSTKNPHEPHHPPSQTHKSSRTIHKGDSSSSGTNDTGTLSSSSSSSYFPDDPVLQSLYKQMPPHIQDIARRRPELVEKLLHAKQHELEQQKQQQKHTTETILEEEEDEMANEENDDLPPYDDNNDDETTSLIQRRRPTKYKSVDSKNTTSSE